MTASIRNAEELNDSIEAGYNGTGSSTLFISESTVLAEGGDQARAIQAPFDAALDIRASTITAIGGQFQVANRGVSSRGADSRLTDSQITSDGWGVASDNGILVVRNCEIFGQETGARGELRIFDSQIEGVTNRALTSAGGSTTRVAGSQLIGDVVGASCVAIYDETYSFFPESCP